MLAVGGPWHGRDFTGADPSPTVSVPTVRPNLAGELVAEMHTYRRESMTVVAEHPCVPGAHLHGTWPVLRHTAYQDQEPPWALMGPPRVALRRTHLVTVGGRHRPGPAWWAPPG